MTAGLEDENGWSAAEERVGALYRALGYTVTRDVLTRGSQVDLVAVQTMPGIGRVRIGVEVKDHPGKSMPISEVRTFKGNAKVWLDDDDFDKVHLVTTGTITPKSRLLVEGAPHIRVLTYEELESELFHPDPALARWLHHYERSPINRRFVEVTATRLDLQQWSGGAATQLPATDLLNVAIASPSSAVVVLADYGAGKSTVMERIKAVAIKRRSSQPSAPVPILIRLRDLPEGFDVETVALDALRSQLDDPMPAELFWDLLGAGRFVILLDGFDEITLRASADTRERLLATLSPLLFGQSPAILTSRPSYFASLGEYAELLERMSAGRPRPDPAAPDEKRIDRHVGDLLDLYRVSLPKTPVRATASTYKLDKLAEPQIHQFLELVAPELAQVDTTPDGLYKFLAGVYDLSELISRPIILDMAVASTMRGVIKPGQKTLEDGPAGLYEAYAKLRLERDWTNVENRQELLTHDERMRFAEECAVHMHDRGVLRLEPDEISGVAALTRPTRSDEDPEEILTDLRTCSFLTVDDSGALEFIHRSYQEFFYARRIRNQLLANLTTRLSDALRWEYAYFLGSMGYTNDTVYRRFTELSRTRADRGGTPGQIADNAAQALLIARDVARGLDWQHRTVTALSRPRTQIVSSKLQDVILTGLSLDHLNITDATLDMRITGDQVGEVTLTNCTGQVRASGEIAMISADGGNLDLHWDTQAGRACFDSMGVSLTAGDGLYTFRRAAGRARIGDSTVQIAASELVLTSSGTITGTCDDSLIDIGVAGWDRLGTAITRTAVVVQGARPETKVATETRRTKSIVDGSPPGTDSVVVVDPSVTVDRWWMRQEGLVTIGARIADGRTQLLGLFLYEQPRPDVGAEDDAESTGGVLEFWYSGAGTVVMEGRGKRFDDARANLHQIAGKATAKTVANGTWLHTKLAPALQPLGCSADAIDQLAELIDTRVGQSGTGV
jgi:hypothetical protein